MSFGDGFLRFPDLFPGRRSGEPWGDRSLILEVAGGPYLVAGLSAAQEDAARRKFEGLCRQAETAAEVAIQLFQAPPEDFVDRDVRGWEYTLDMDYSPGSVLLAGLRLMGRIDWMPGLAGGLWTSQAGGEEWASVFENYFRVLAAYRLIEQGGAMLHSAGVTDGASAWLLLGPSGAGKTTSSRLCLEKGAMVLSDDLNAVLLPPVGPHHPGPPLPGEETLMPFYGTTKGMKTPECGDCGDEGRSSGMPFEASPPGPLSLTGEGEGDADSGPILRARPSRGGSPSPVTERGPGGEASKGMPPHPSPDPFSEPRLVRLPFTGDLGARSGGPPSYPLAAVVRLVKGTEDRLRPLSPAAALARLVAAAPFVNRDPWRREALLGTLERLARAVPAYELELSLGGGLWDILKAIPT